jgi:hypothetical protein
MGNLLQGEKPALVDETATRLDGPDLGVSEAADPPG